MAGRPAPRFTFSSRPKAFPALHQLKTDELWHFYAGDPVEHLQLDPRDNSTRLAPVLGPDVLAGQAPQLNVRGGLWQGRGWPFARSGQPNKTQGWALLGCTHGAGLG